MNIEILLFKEIVIFPELFLGISIIYLVLHSTFLAIQKKYPLIQSSVLYLSILVLIFASFLVYNEHLNSVEMSCLNNTYVSDYISFISKIVIGSLSVFCLLMMHSYILTQQINNFEYFLLFLFSVLGLFLLCSSNDLLTAYLAIELQSLSFYVLAAFKKNSTFSVDAGIKYFILGAFASSMFLFGSSLLYGLTGSVSFDDFQVLFVNTFPGQPVSNIAFYEVLEESFHDTCYSVCVTYPDLIWLFSTEIGTIFSIFDCQYDVRETYVNFNYLENSIGLDSILNSSFDVSLIKFALIFILIALFFKLTIAPFHIWAPDVYEGSPSSSTFFFSVVPKLAIFVLLIRIFYFSFYGFVDSWRHFIILTVIFSVIIGSFGGLNQRKLKTLLVYSTISHMGYSLIAFSAGTFESLQMLFSYLIVYSFSGLCIWSIFMSTQLKNTYTQKQNKDLTDLVLLGKSNYMLAIFFTTVLFSVAGFPPMIGFLVKMGVFLTAMEASMYFVALVSILCSVVGTFYYIRLIKILYFEKVLVGKLYHPINSQSSVLITLLFFLFLFLFCNPTLLFLVSQKLSLLIFF
jgi:NADH:ubiquinone oxidoreductase subunit 2 (subunit N)